MFFSTKKQKSDRKRKEEKENEEEGEPHREKHRGIPLRSSLPTAPSKTRLFLSPSSSPRRSLSPIVRRPPSSSSLRRKQQPRKEHSKGHRERRGRDVASSSSYSSPSSSSSSKDSSEESSSSSQKKICRHLGPSPPVFIDLCGEEEEEEAEVEEERENKREGEGSKDRKKEGPGDLSERKRKKIEETSHDEGVETDGEDHLQNGSSFSSRGGAPSLSHRQQEEEEELTSLPSQKKRALQTSSSSLLFPSSSSSSSAAAPSAFLFPAYAPSLRPSSENSLTCSSFSSFTGSDQASLSSLPQASLQPSSLCSSSLFTSSSSRKDSSVSSTISGLLRNISPLNQNEAYPSSSSLPLGSSSSSLRLSSQVEEEQQQHAAEDTSEERKKEKDQGWLTIGKSFHPSLLQGEEEEEKKAKKKKKKKEEKSRRKDRLEPSATSPSSSSSFLSSKTHGEFLSSNRALGLYSDREGKTHRQGEERREGLLESEGDAFLRNRTRVCAEGGGEEEEDALLHLLPRGSEGLNEVRMLLDQDEEKVKRRTRKNASYEEEKQKILRDLEEEEFHTHQGNQPPGFLSISPLSSSSSSSRLFRMDDLKKLLGEDDEGAVRDSSSSPLGVKKANERISRDLEGLDLSSSSVVEDEVDVHGPEKRRRRRKRDGRDEDEEEKEDDEEEEAAARISLRLLSFSLVDGPGIDDGRREVASSPSTHVSMMEKEQKEGPAIDSGEKEVFEKGEAAYATKLEEREKSRSSQKELPFYTRIPYLISSFPSSSFFPSSSLVLSHLARATQRPNDFKALTQSSSFSRPASLFRLPILLQEEYPSSDPKQSPYTTASTHSDYKPNLHHSCLSQKKSSSSGQTDSVSAALSSSSSSLSLQEGKIFLEEGRDKEQEEEEEGRQGGGDTVSFEVVFDVDGEAETSGDHHRHSPASASVSSSSVQEKKPVNRKENQNDLALSSSSSSPPADLLFSEFFQVQRLQDRLLQKCRLSHTSDPDAWLALSIVSQYLLPLFSSSSAHSSTQQVYSKQIYFLDCARRALKTGFLDENLQFFLIQVSLLSSREESTFIHHLWLGELSTALSLSSFSVDNASASLPLSTSPQERSRDVSISPFFSSSSSSSFFLSSSQSRLWLEYFFFACGGAGGIHFEAYTTDYSRMLAADLIAFLSREEKETRKPPRAIQKIQDNGGELLQGKMRDEQKAEKEERSRNRRDRQRVTIIHRLIGEREKKAKAMNFFFIALELCLEGMISCERLSGHQGFLIAFIQALLHLYLYGRSLGSSPESQSLALQQLQQANELSTEEGKGFLEFGDLFAGYVLSSTYDIISLSTSLASRTGGENKSLSLFSPLPPSSPGGEGGEEENKDGEEGTTAAAEEEEAEKEKRRRKRRNAFLRVCEGVDESIRTRQQKRRRTSFFEKQRDEIDRQKEKKKMCPLQEKEKKSYLVTSLFSMEQQRRLSSFLISLMNTSSSSSSLFLSSFSSSDGFLDQHFFSSFFRLFEWYLACERAAESLSWRRFSPSSFPVLDEEEDEKEEEEEEAKTTEAERTISSSHPSLQPADRGRKERRSLGGSSPSEVLLEICLNFPGVSSAWGKDTQGEDTREQEEENNEKKFDFLPILSQQKRKEQEKRRQEEEGDRRREEWSLSIERFYREENEMTEKYKVREMLLRCLDCLGAPTVHRYCSNHPRAIRLMEESIDEKLLLTLAALQSLSQSHFLPSSHQDFFTPSPSSSSSVHFSSSSSTESLFPYSLFSSSSSLSKTEIGSCGVLFSSWWPDITLEGEEEEEGGSEERISSSLFSTWKFIEERLSQKIRQGKFSKGREISLSDPSELSSGDRLTNEEEGEGQQKRTKKKKKEQPGEETGCTETSRLLADTLTRAEHLSLLISQALLCLPSDVFDPPLYLLLSYSLLSLCRVHKVSKGLLKVFESSPALWLAYASSLYNGVFRLRLSSSSSSSSFSSAESVSGRRERDDEEETKKKKNEEEAEERGRHVGGMELEREDDTREEGREEKILGEEENKKKKGKKKKNEDKKGDERASKQSKDVLHSARKVMLTCSTAFSHSLPLAASWCHLENLLPSPSSSPLSFLLSRPLSGPSSSSSFSRRSPSLSSSLLFSPSLSPQQVVWISELSQSSSFLSHISLGTLSWIYRYLSSSSSFPPSFFSSFSHDKSEEKRRRTLSSLPRLVPWEGQGVSLWAVEIACCAAEENFESLHRRLLLSRKQKHDQEKKEKDNEEGEEQDAHGRRGEGGRRKKDMVMTRREQEEEDSSSHETLRMRCVKAVHTLEKKLEKFLEREEEFLSSLSNRHQDEETFPLLSSPFFSCVYLLCVLTSMLHLEPPRQHRDPLCGERPVPAVWRVFRSFGVASFRRFLLAKKNQKRREEMMAKEKREGGMKQKSGEDEIFRESIQGLGFDQKKTEGLFADLSLRNLTGISSVSSSVDLYGEEARCFELSFFFFLSLLLSLSSSSLSSTSSMSCNRLVSPPGSYKTEDAGEEEERKRVSFETRRGEREEGEKDKEKDEKKEEEYQIDLRWRRSEDEKVLLNACEAALSFFPRNRFFLGVYVQTYRKLHSMFDTRARLLLYLHLPSSSQIASSSSSSSSSSSAYPSTVLQRRKKAKKKKIQMESTTRKEEEERNEDTLSLLDDSGITKKEQEGEEEEESCYFAEGGFSLLAVEACILVELSSSHPSLAFLYQVFERSFQAIQNSILYEGWRSPPPSSSLPFLDLLSSSSSSSFVRSSRCGDLALSSSVSSYRSTLVHEVVFNLYIHVLFLEYLDLSSLLLLHSSSCSSRALPSPRKDDALALHSFKTSSSENAQERRRRKRRTPEDQEEEQRILVEEKEPEKEEMKKKAKVKNGIGDEVVLALQAESTEERGDEGTKKPREEEKKEEKEEEVREDSLKKERCRMMKTVILGKGRLDRLKKKRKKLTQDIRKVLIRALTSFPYSKRLWLQRVRYVVLQRDFHRLKEETRERSSRASLLHQHSSSSSSSFSQASHTPHDSRQISSSPSLSSSSSSASLPLRKTEEQLKEKDDARKDREIDREEEEGDKKEEGLSEEAEKEEEKDDKGAKIKKKFEVGECSSGLLERKERNSSWIEKKKEESKGPSDRRSEEEFDRFNHRISEEEEVLLDMLSQMLWEKEISFILDPLLSIL